MFVFGKIIGAVAGILLIPSPLGIFVGLILGHFSDLYQQRRYREKLAGGPRQTIFQDSDTFVPLVYTLYGRITAQTGGPNHLQITYIEQVLGASFSFFFFEREAAVQAFNAALRSPGLSPEQAAQELTESWFLDQNTLLTIFRTCVELASLAQPLRPGVAETLSRVGRIFGFQYTAGSTSSQYRPPQKPVQDDYSTLGLRSDTPSEEIKKRYRTLARQYHPDSLAHLEDTDPKKKQAQEQFIRIQEAYDRIKASRGIA